MKAPLFVKIEHYREITETINKIKSKLEEAKEILNRLNEVKLREEGEIRNWQEELNNAETRLNSIEEQLPKPEAEK